MSDLTDVALTVEGAIRAKDDRIAELEAENEALKQQRDRWINAAKELYEENEALREVAEAAKSVIKNPEYFGAKQRLREALAKWEKTNEED